MSKRRLNHHERQHPRDGKAMLRLLNREGIPVADVVRRRDGVFIADFRTEKPSSWDGHMRYSDHVPDARHFIRLMQRVLPEIEVVNTHESITTWRDDPTNQVRYETTVLFRLGAPDYTLDAPA